MDDTSVLSRRDFMKIAGVGALLTAYAAKTAGAGEEGRLDAQAKTTAIPKESASEKPIDSGYWDLMSQVRANAILDGRLNPNSNASYCIR